MQLSYLGNSSAEPEYKNQLMLYMCGPVPAAFSFWMAIVRGILKTYLPVYILTDHKVS